MQKKIPPIAGRDFGSKNITLRPCRGGGAAVHGLDLFEVLDGTNAVGCIVDHRAVLEHAAVGLHLALDGAKNLLSEYC